MIINNLIIKLKGRNENEIERAKDVLLSMKGKIPVLLDIQVKKDVRGSGESPYDIMLITQFNTVEDRKLYLDHPVHVEVAKYISDVTEVSASLCYEL
ncbi:MAG: Dabb family protein [Fusobacteriaceae bacterium]|jgi:hypothetical protein|nr:Dabb family protein [Fusobacteriaceae bacterium]